MSKHSQKRALEEVSRPSGLSQAASIPSVLSEDRRAVVISSETGSGPGLGSQGSEKSTRQ